VKVDSRLKTPLRSGPVFIFTPSLLTPHHAKNVSALFPDALAAQASSLAGLVYKDAPPALFPLLAAPARSFGPPVTSDPILCHSLSNNIYKRQQVFKMLVTPMSVTPEQHKIIEANKSNVSSTFFIFH
jgi:hypothetical protein